MNSPKQQEPVSVAVNKPTNFFKRFWWIGLIILIIFLIIVSLIFLLKNNSPSQDIIQSNISDNTNCNDIFTYEFVDYDRIDAFQPIGSITGASRGRSYITIKKSQIVAVYTPMDATLVSIIYAYRGPDSVLGEYGFKFNTNCEVTFLLDHIDMISDELKEYAPTEPSRSTATSDDLSIPVKGGTLLGYTDGTIQARTFDFLVLDRKINTFHINPDRWEWEQSLYSVCPYDLYSEELQEKYYTKIGFESDSGFIKAENCGNISYDIPNTISGGWFLNDASTDLKGEFMLIGSIGDRVDIVVKNDSETTNLRITDYSPEILPANVTAGQSVCYEGFSNDWVYLHLVDENTIDVAKGNGDCPTYFPARGTKRYYR